MMDDIRESYTFIVASTTSNKTEGETPTVAETDEQRGVPKWNLQQDPKLRAPVRKSLEEKLMWIRQLAEKVNWMLDLGFRAFFDTIDHECLIISLSTA